MLHNTSIQYNRIKNEGTFEKNRRNNIISLDSSLKTKLDINLADKGSSSEDSSFNGLFFASVLATAWRSD